MYFAAQVEVEVEVEGEDKFVVEVPLNPPRLPAPCPFPCILQLKLKLKLKIKLKLKFRLPTSYTLPVHLYPAAQVEVLIFASTFGLFLLTSLNCQLISYDILVVCCPRYLIVVPLAGAKSRFIITLPANTICNLCQPTLKVI